MNLRQKLTVYFVAAAGLLFLAPLMTSCGGALTPTPQPVAAPVTLSASDVNSVVEQAAQSVNVPLVIAVVDRLGNILALLVEPGAPATARYRCPSCSPDTSPGNLPAARELH